MPIRTWIVGMAVELARHVLQILPIKGHQGLRLLGVKHKPFESIQKCGHHIAFKDEGCFICSN